MPELSWEWFLHKTFIVVCVLYCLLGSFVIVHVCVACTLVRLIV